MFRSLANAIKTKSDKAQKARQYERRVQDTCAVKIAGQLHPIVDWSPGGAFVTANADFFTLGDTVDCLMQFRGDDTITRLPVTGTIIRKNTQGVALEFTNISKEAEQQFLEILRA